jgi:HAD superfamily hydrolase (TIGR01509 family)
MAVSAVFFDVGATLVDETRMFEGWADWLGVSRVDFHAALGATIEARAPHRRVFELMAPDADLAAVRAARRAAGAEFAIEPRDLYPDALACLEACRAAGLYVGVAGNQPASAAAALLNCGMMVDHLATSEEWGVSKPDPAFFERVAQACGRPPAEIAYVGDRVDNDVVPARLAGMLPVLVARGPWGVVQTAWPEAAQAALVVRRLEGLAPLLAGL